MARLAEAGSETPLARPAVSARGLYKSYARSQTGMSAPPAGGAAAPGDVVRTPLRDAGGAGVGGRLPVLADVTFDVRPGEFVSFIGPSGSGKSTLLNILAGLEEPDAGAVEAGGSSRRLGAAAYMPQSHSLLPWRTALDNAILGLEVRGAPKAEARERARELFAVAGLAGFEHALPAVLSGGMRQRVAFLRTVLTGGAVLLLDEPFGALDALTRADMQEWLLELWEGMRSAAVLVTHDVEEALLLSDRVYVLSPRPGRITRVHAVSLPRPRRMEMVADPTFAAAKAALLAAVRGERA